MEKEVGNTCIPCAVQNLGGEVVSMIVGIEILLSLILFIGSYESFRVVNDCKPIGGFGLFFVILYIFPTVALCVKYISDCNERRKDNEKGGGLCIFSCEGNWSTVFMIIGIISLGLCLFSFYVAASSILVITKVSCPIFFNSNFYAAIFAIFLVPITLYCFHNTLDCNAKYKKD